MKVSRRKVIDMGFTLMKAEQTFKTPITGKFYYACAKNRELAMEEYKLYLDANPYPPQYDEYQAKKEKILDEVGESIRPDFTKLSEDARNAILNSPDTNVMPQDKRDLMISKLNALRGEYKDLMEEVNNVELSRKEYLDEEDDFPIKRVKLSDIPQIINGNGFKVMLGLDPMIIDEDETTEG